MQSHTPPTPSPQPFYSRLVHVHYNFISLRIIPVYQVSLTISALFCIHSPLYGEVRERNLQPLRDLHASFGVNAQIYRPSFISFCCCNSIYLSLLAKRPQTINHCFLFVQYAGTYFLTAKTVEPQKQPLLGNGSETTFLISIRSCYWVTRSQTHMFARELFGYNNKRRFLRGPCQEVIYREHKPSCSQTVLSD
jgi:hypothetical protein